MNLNQVTVPSIDVKRSIKYYQKLGLKLIVEALPNYARFLCTDGDSTFSVHKVSSLDSSNSTYIYFECRDLEKKVAELKSQKVEFKQSLEEKSWLWKEARLQDPDGNHIVLYYAGENRINPPWRIKE